MKVSGIRISHMSHLGKDETLALSTGRGGKTVAYKVGGLAETAAAEPPPVLASSGAAVDEVATPPRQINGSATLPLEHLRKEGLASAEKGTEELKQFWAWLGKDEKAALKVELEKDWKTLAQKADIAAAARKEEFLL